MPNNLRVALNPIFTLSNSVILLSHMSSLWNVHVKTTKVRYLSHLSSIHVKLRKKNMMVGYPEASVPLSVRIKSCKQAFIGCCSSFDIIATIEYSLRLFLSVFNLLNVH